MQTQFGRGLIIEARVHLLESLVWSRLIHPVIPERATNADGHLWKPVVIKVKATRNRVVTDVTWIEVDVRIKFPLQVYFARQIVLCPHSGVENVHSSGRACIEICPESGRIDA